MRDPWVPIALALIVLLTVWLGIFGPLPSGVEAWLSKWQTLVAATVAATVASIAAYIAFRNTSRSLVHNEALEERRRRRKHAALRAMLPLALTAVSDYAEHSARALNDLIGKCQGESLPRMAAPADLAQPLPSQALETLADFIEYSDEIDVSVLEATVAWIQVHDARVRGLVNNNLDPTGSYLVLRANIEDGIIDAASIYAGVGCIYEYARRRSSQIPHILTWDGVLSALGNMRFWEHEHPRLCQIVDRRRQRSAGPFEMLNPNAG